MSAPSTTPSPQPDPGTNGNGPRHASEGGGGSFFALSKAASQIGALAGAVAGLVAFVYVVGGAVMWIRFRTAQLPPDQAVGLVSRNDLMVVGLRVLVLPALLAGVVFFMLAARHRSRLRSELDGEVSKLRTAIGLAGILVLLAVVPFSPGALAWPLAALVLVLVWTRSLAAAYRPNGVSNFPLWRACAVAMLLAAVVSMARQLDHPVQLPAVTVQVGHEPKQIGVLVSETGDEVAVGFPDIHSIRLFRSSDVTSLLIGTQLDRRAPSRSLLSRVLGGAPWAATPVDVWCGGEHYAPWDIAKLCATQPVVTGMSAESSATAGVEVRCPRKAQPACSGFLTLDTAHALSVPSLGRKATAVVGTTSFQIPADTKLRVDVPVNAELRRILAAGANPVQLDAVASLDLAGGAVVARSVVTTTFKAPGGPAKASPRPHRASHHATPPAKNGGAGAAPTATATPTPTPTATPTPTPTATPGPTATATPDAPTEAPAPTAPIDLGTGGG